METLNLFEIERRARLERAEWTYAAVRSLAARIRARLAGGARAAA